MGDLDILDRVARSLPERFRVDAGNRVAPALLAPQTRFLRGIRPGSVRLRRRVEHAPDNLIAAPVGFLFAVLLGFALLGHEGTIAWRGQRPNLAQAGTSTNGTSR
jgi:hypothetical protein